MHPLPNEPVTVKVCGNVIEVRYMAVAPSGGVIQKLNADSFLDKRTGEVRAFDHTENRAESKATVAQSLRNLWDIINTNLTDPDQALWVTLTYRENMKDSARLYEDFRRFWLRFHYRYSAEYIVAAEPQARGAWHLHCLFLFPHKAPFIPNDTIASLWRQGNTKTKSLKGLDNPGLYLTAYLGDMELSEVLMTPGLQGKQIVEKMVVDQGSKKKKAIIKGARLSMYPPGFRLFRCSRGVKRPKIMHMTEAKAQAMIKDSPLVFEKTIEVKNNSGEILNTINYRQYNRMQKGEKRQQNND